MEGFWSLEPKIMSQLFYHYATPASPEYINSWYFIHSVMWWWDLKPWTLDNESLVLPLCYPSQPRWNELLILHSFGDAMVGFESLNLRKWINCSTTALPQPAQMKWTLDISFIRWCDGGIRSLEPKIMSHLFYHCTTPASPDEMNSWYFIHSVMRWWDSKSWT